MNDTKQKIFNAAAELFANKCYSDVGIRDIAKAANVKSATIYYYYESKEEILNELLEFCLNRLKELTPPVETLDFSKDILENFSKIVFSFREDEVQLMVWLIKIVFNEQFRANKAAQIIYGQIIKKGAEEYGKFFLLLEEKGLIQGNFHKYYGELISRIMMTFTMQYVNDIISYEEEKHLDKDMLDMLTFIVNMARSYDEKNKV